MLSGAASSLAATAAPASSATVLKASLNTAVTGSKIIFTATVENAGSDAPIASGKVKFVVESPKSTVLGTASVNKQGEASIVTSDLTQIGNYQVEAQFTPKSSSISASTSVPVTVAVIPVPLEVPTVTTVETGASLAEVGQYVPLRATVTDAGTGVAVNAGKVEPIAGKVEFVTQSADPIVLGEASVNSAGLAAISTNKLKNAGPYQIQAEFVPANQYFAASASAPVTVTINPTTVNSPTATSIQAVTSSVETGEGIALSATVQNSSSTLADGVVEFITVSAHPVILGEVAASAFGQPVNFTTFALQKFGTYQIEAEYVPNNNRFAESTSSPVTVTVTPLSAASFRLTPLPRHGHLGEPMNFTVTALNAKKQPITNYTGTVVLSSPTDSWTTLPRGIYISLNLTPPPPQTTGLASFPATVYTFTPADHGTHEFIGGITFGKGGAEVLKVGQANNSKVYGKTTFAIG